MVENVIISSYSAISDVFLRCYMAVHEPSQLNIPAFWLEPVFHSVYLQAMVNFEEKYGEVDQSNVQTIEIRPGMHSLMRTHNLLRQLGFSPSPQSGFDFGFPFPPQHTERWAKLPSLVKTLGKRSWRSLNIHLCVTTCFNTLGKKTRMQALCSFDLVSILGRTVVFYSVERLVRLCKWRLFCWDQENLPT